MTTYTIAWGWDETNPSGQHTIPVHTDADVHAALDQIAAQDGVCRIDVYQGTWREGEPTPPYGMQAMWGHPERTALAWLGQDPGHAVDPILPEWPEAIAHDQDEAAPSHTRLNLASTRSAICEYVRTGAKPTAVTWIPEP
ncbi:MAG: hypothetical protein KJO75_08435 [Dactylosporangium sp.]|nr:hypothetical protein [Dactylosporangium sp.]